MRPNEAEISEKKDCISKDDDIPFTATRAATAANLGIERALIIEIQKNAVVKESHVLLMPSKSRAEPDSTNHPFQK